MQSRMAGRRGFLASRCAGEAGSTGRGGDFVVKGKDA